MSSIPTERGGFKTPACTATLDGVHYGVHHEARTTAAIDLQNGTAREATPAQVAKVMDADSRLAWEVLIVELEVV